MIDRSLVRDLFGISGFNVAWYGVIIATGMALGIILATKEARRQGYKPDLVTDFVYLAIPLAIICARLYYVIFEWGSYSHNLSKIVAIWEGGLAIYGGVIGGFIAALLFSKVNKFPLFKIIDIAVPSLILGQAIGRWGNFVNQEAFGNIVTSKSLQFFPFAVYIKQLSEWHQATFFYESMWNLLVFFALMSYRKRSRFDGNLLAIYFIGYGIGRFFIEGLRTDSLYIIPGIRVSQALSVILAAVGILMIVSHKKIFNKNESYTGKYSVSECKAET